jgi:aryl-alcohol dehydrogenase-like predicted oxidoreductase
VSGDTVLTLLLRYVGAMGISFGLGNNLTLEQAEPVLLKALELGCTFWDTAVC